MRFYVYKIEENIKNNYIIKHSNLSAADNIYISAPVSTTTGNTKNYVKTNVYNILYVHAYTTIKFKIIKNK